jgi:hypothetical protein
MKLNLNSLHADHQSTLLRLAAVAVILCMTTTQADAQQASSAVPSISPSPYARWTNGPGKDAGFFPIAVWLQAPHNAPKYQAIGINMYIGLWQGPTEQQIAELKRYHMPVICEQNPYAMNHLAEKTIVGWMHGDEPDNAQALPNGKGYGPPIAPEKIIKDYRKIQAADPTRPVMLNLGQGVAWDAWHGRGTRTNHPEDYPQYVQGGDIISFDIYPAVHDNFAVAGKLWYVPTGVKRLRAWTGGARVVWDCIECTRIGNKTTKPTPQQVKAEVWMSIIHGSQGIIYFCHQFQPRFVEAGLLADDEMARAVGAINLQIKSLAAVINSPSMPVAVTASPVAVSKDMVALLGSWPIAAVMKKHDGRLYVFAVRMDNAAAKGTFQIGGLQGDVAIHALGENRTLTSHNGRFEDTFAPYAVHLYQIGR